MLLRSGWCERQVFYRSFGSRGLETDSQWGPAERLVNVTESAARAVPHNRPAFHSMQCGMCVCWGWRGEEKSQKGQRRCAWRGENKREYSFTIKAAFERLLCAVRWFWVTIRPCVKTFTPHSHSGNGSMWIVMCDRPRVLICELIRKKRRIVIL